MTAAKGIPYCAYQRIGIIGLPYSFLFIYLACLLQKVGSRVSLTATIIIYVMSLNKMLTMRGTEKKCYVTKKRGKRNPSQAEHICEEDAVFLFLK